MGTYWDGTKVQLLEHTNTQSSIYSMLQKSFKLEAHVRLNLVRISNRGNLCLGNCML